MGLLVLGQPIISKGDFFAGNFLNFLLSFVFSRFGAIAGGVVNVWGGA